VSAVLIVVYIFAPVQKTSYAGGGVRRAEAGKCLSSGKKMDLEKPCPEKSYICKKFGILE
jgi:hypothetical protein